MGRQSFVEVGLFVTGRAEEAALEQLFSRFVATGLCNFKVVRRISQFNPRIREKRSAATRTQDLEVIGRGGTLPTRRVQQISLPVRGFLRGKEHRLVVIVDDLEFERRSEAREVLGLYREAAEELLDDVETSRVGVHFLVMMLEAYFFADPAALDSGLGLTVEPPNDNVEEIRNPKANLKALFPEYRERAHGAALLRSLDLFTVLDDPETCSWLRSCVLWTFQRVRSLLSEELHPQLDDLALRCHLRHGRVQPLSLEMNSTTQDI